MDCTTLRRRKSWYDDHKSMQMTTDVPVTTCHCPVYTMEMGCHGSETHYHQHLADCGEHYCKFDKTTFAFDRTVIAQTYSGCSPAHGDIFRPTHTVGDYTGQDAYTVTEIVHDLRHASMYTTYSLFGASSVYQHLMPCEGGWVQRRDHGCQLHYQEINCDERRLKFKNIDCAPLTADACRYEEAVLGPGIKYRQAYLRSCQPEPSATQQTLFEVAGNTEASYTSFIYQHGWSSTHTVTHYVPSQHLKPCPSQRTRCHTYFDGSQETSKCETATLCSVMNTIVQEICDHASTSYEPGPDYCGSHGCHVRYLVTGPSYREDRSSYAENCHEVREHASNMNALPVTTNYMNPTSIRSQHPACSDNVISGTHTMSQMIVVDQTTMATHEFHVIFDEHTHTLESSSPSALLSSHWPDRSSHWHSATKTPSIIPSSDLTPTDTSSHPSVPGMFARTTLKRALSFTFTGDHYKYTPVAYVCTLNQSTNFPPLLLYVIFRNCPSERRYQRPSFHVFLVKKYCCGHRFPRKRSPDIFDEEQLIRLKASFFRLMLQPLFSSQSPQ